MHKFICFLSILLLLSACANPNTAPHSSHHSVEFKQLSTDNTPINQQVSNEAKDMIHVNEGITHIYAVNSNEQMIVAFEIDHLKRFKLKAYEKDISEKLKKAFSNFEVNVSTDQKIIIEVDKLEQVLESGSISEKELNEKIKHIIKLSKEKT